MQHLGLFNASALDELERLEVKKEAKDAQKNTGAVITSAVNPAQDIIKIASGQGTIPSAPTPSNIAAAEAGIALNDFVAAINLGRYAQLMVATAPVSMEDIALARAVIYDSITQLSGHNIGAAVKAKLNALLSTLSGYLNGRLMNAEQWTTFTPPPPPCRCALFAIGSMGIPI